MTWQLLMTAYLILGTAGYLLRRKLALTLTRYNRLVNGFFFIAILYPLGLLVASFTNPNLAIGWQNILILLIGSGVFPLLNLLAFKSSKDVDAGLYTILNNLTPIITIIGAYLLLQEKMSTQQLVGAAVIIASTFLATLPRLWHRSKNSSSIGVILALASVSLLGLAIVFERWMLTRIDFGAYLVFGWGSQALWMAIMSWPERKNLHILTNRKNFLPILGYGVTNALRGLCWVSAVKLSGNVSIVGAFSSFMAVLVVLSAYFILKEKEWVWFKIGAAIIGTIGLIILNTA
jgi:drug/metabolite transporter (DMT)-like permease